MLNISVCFGFQFFYVTMFVSDDKIDSIRGDKSRRGGGHRLGQFFIHLLVH